MYLLSIETSCDETAAAVIREDGEILSGVVASQAKLHAEYGGVVPEIASRAHMERILPVLDQAIRQANITLQDLNAVAVTHTPGLAGSLLVGLVAAKTLAATLEIPLIGLNHLQSHIYACKIANKTDVFPCVGFVVSGGHSNLYKCDSSLDFELLGTTIDDAAGEAFDKVAAMLGLPYPGGPNIQKAAEKGDKTAYAFPRAFIHDKNRLDFSFSGLKTALRYTLEKMPPREATARMPDLCASYQQAVIDALARKTANALFQNRNAAAAERYRSLGLSGGVANNRALRAALERLAKNHRLPLHMPEPRHTGDNAGMIAFAAWSDPAVAPAAPSATAIDPSLELA